MVVRNNKLREKHESDLPLSMRTLLPTSLLFLLKRTKKSRLQIAERERERERERGGERERER